MSRCQGNFDRARAAAAADLGTSNEPAEEGGVFNEFLATGVMEYLEAPTLWCEFGAGNIVETSSEPVGDECDTETDGGETRKGPLVEFVLEPLAVEVFCDSGREGGADDKGLAPDKNWALALEGLDCLLVILGWFVGESTRSKVLPLNVLNNTVPGMIRLENLD